MSKDMMPFHDAVWFGFAGNTASVSCGMGSVQMYQQQVHQAVQQGAPSHPAYQGQQHFSDSASYADGNANTGSMACLYQNYQVRF